MSERSAWLDIPLDDYERHMALPSIGQASMLADQLEHLIARRSPRSVAVAGCAGGNGFERIGPTVERIVAIDINPAYLEAVQDRFAARLSGLELYCADVGSAALRFAPVDLIYAGLIFEYVDPAAALATFRRNLRAQGALAALVQLPAGQSRVSQSPYLSLKALSGSMRLILPTDLCRAAASAGFVPDDSRSIGLASGKRFHLQVFAARR